MRSSMPPWPGSMVPESLTPAPRLMADSSRSPSWAAMLRTCGEQKRLPHRLGGVEDQVAVRAEHVADVDDDESGEDAADNAGGGAFPGLAGAEARSQLVAAEAAADVECRDVTRPDADHQEDDQRDAVLLLPEQGNEGEGIGDVDEAEDALCGIGQHLNERGAEAVPGEEGERKRAEDGELRFDGKVGQGDDEGERGGEGHPPEGDAELGAVGLRADGGELEILVGGELGDDGRDEGNHPELAEEDEREDGGDEDDGSEDSFHVV